MPCLISRQYICIRLWIVMQWENHLPSHVQSLIGNAFLRSFNSLIKLLFTSLYHNCSSSIFLCNTKESHIIVVICLSSWPVLISLSLSSNRWSQVTHMLPVVGPFLRPRTNQLRFSKYGVTAAAAGFISSCGATSCLYFD